MEAVLQVLETEAVGLAPGQHADVIIDAFPDRPLTGVVKSISATAAPIARDVPIKFFSVIVSLDESDPTWITPEAQVTAEIHISRIEDTIAIPNQAMFQDETGDWVLVRNGSGLEKRSVSLGLRGANRSEVVSGLQAGDEIALYPPEGWDL
ncbi:efflux RND transporter periplasmic adaptor subunit, partial [Pseudomonadota bacterium]